MRPEAMQRAFTIGVDYGTSSVRALVVDCTDGRELGTAKNRDANRKLNIGYFSPDFRRHPVTFFVEPVIMSHHRDAFTVFCYSDVSVPDTFTRRVQNHSDRWCHLAGVSDDKAVELVRSDGIDILIDLAGHTANNRMLLFARKPAPIQLTWIGYPATTGLQTIDYKIVDHYTDPPGTTEQFYSEQLMRLPNSFVCYLHDEDSPDVGPLPAAKVGYCSVRNKRYGCPEQSQRIFA